MLHVLNGDSTRGSLERSTVPGALAVWADVLYEGPVPGPDAPAEEWHRVRSGYLADAGYADRERALQRGRAWDAGLAAYRDHEEVVIWCEHDLFDQLLLIRHLDWFGRQQPPPAGLSLVCIGEHAGVEPFMGLGQLRPEQLAALLPTRVEVTPAMLELGERAWAAFTAPDPRGLEAIARAGTPSLPFLAPGLDRLLEDYPSTAEGLSLTQRRLLELLGDGPRSTHDLFHAMHRGERFYFITDDSLRLLLEDLAAEPAPAITLEIGGDRNGGLPDGSAALTELGRDLLAGTQDRPQLHPIDRWIGGVHLHGPRPPWRWNRDRQSIVAS